MKAKIQLRGRRGVPLGSEQSVKKPEFLSRRPKKDHVQKELEDAKHKVQSLSARMIKV